MSVWLIIMIVVIILREASQIRQALSHLRSAGIKGVCAFKKEFHIATLTMNSLCVNSGCP